jgi:hypothetical protein
MKDLVINRQKDPPPRRKDAKESKRAVFFLLGVFGSWW